MIMILQGIFLLISLLQPSWAGKPITAHWTYVGDIGHDKWEVYHNQCGGESQSPIDIVCKDALYREDLAGGFDRTTLEQKPKSMTLKNNGHALQVDLEEGYTIDNGPLPGKFQALQYHFHWASDVNVGGSEHTMDGHRYFAELHIVHINKAYASLKEALQKQDGLAVLGFFIEIGEHNEVFDRLLEPIRDGKVVFKEDKYKYENAWPISDLLPENLDHFYRYSGSLTTPPCSESVVWTVFKEPIALSENQASELMKKLKADEKGYGVLSESISQNYRPVMKLGDRQVHKSWRKK